MIAIWPPSGIASAILPVATSDLLLAGLLQKGQTVKVVGALADEAARNCEMKSTFDFYRRPVMIGPHEVRHGDSVLFGDGV